MSRRYSTAEPSEEHVVARPKKTVTVYCPPSRTLTVELPVRPIGVLQQCNESRWCIESLQSFQQYYYPNNDNADNHIIIETCKPGKKATRHIDSENNFDDVDGSSNLPMNSKTCTGIEDLIVAHDFDERGTKPPTDTNPNANYL